MPLHFNSVLNQVGIPPAAVRLLRHQDQRSAKGRTPYELWRDDRPAFEAYQSAHSIKKRAKLRSDYWASFVGTPSGETILVGLYRCQYIGVNAAARPWPHADGEDAPGTCDVYELSLDDRLSDLYGCLLIAWGDGKIAWIQRADNQDKAITEIRKEFQEPDFPGFVRFISPLSKIESLPATWVTALSSVRGVYALTCPTTREQYVGSATGKDGFVGRWLSYVRAGQGGNIALKSRDPSDYQVSILQVAGSETDDEVRVMEGYWMLKLQSAEMGLNRNLPHRPAAS